MIKCLSKAKDKVKNFVVENSVAFRRASIGAGATALGVGSSLVSFATDGATGGSAAATATTILQDSVKDISGQVTTFIGNVAPSCFVVFGLILTVSVGIKFVRKFMK